MGPRVFLSHITELLAYTGVNALEAHIRGKTPAVDAFVWLHELVYAYPEDNYDGVFAPIVTAFMARIAKLHRYGAVPFVVFDGEPLKGKGANEKRGAIRAQALLQLDEEYIAAVARGEDEDTITANLDVKLLRAANAVKKELVHAVICELR